MTQPDEFFPEQAINYDSIAALAAKTPESVEAELLNVWSVTLQGLLNGLFEGLRQGINFALAIFEKIADALGLGPAWDTLESVLGAIGEWANNIAGVFWNLLNNPAAVIGNIFNVLVDGINTLGQMIGGLFGAFGGLPGGGSGEGGDALVSDLLEAAGITVPGLNQTVSGLTADVQALQQAELTGKNFVVTFSDYANGESESVGVPFDIDYTGTGSGRSVIVNGVSTWNKVADGDVEAIARYNGPANDGNDTETDTDYQWLQAAAYWPMDVGAEQMFCARMNDDKDSYVYIKGYRPAPLNFRCELGCMVDGVPTVFVTDVPAGWSLKLSLKAGVEGDPYRFQVFSGNSLLIDEVDIDEVSEVGSDFRGWGWGGATADNGAAGLASATRVSCSDNDI